MKKLKNIVIMILLVVPAFACTDILDKGPLDKYSENDVWKSTDLTQAFIYTALKNATDMMIWKDNWTDNEERVCRVMPSISAAREILPWHLSTTFRM